MELQKLSEVELLQVHGQVLNVLKERNVIRSRNNPIGDYTEWLVCKNLNLTMQANSKASYDAEDATGIKYQIKGRCEEKKSVQFSVIRNLDNRGFDYVIAVAFYSDYSIRFAVKISYELVPRFAKFRNHVNGHVLILTDSIQQQDGIEDIRHLLS